MLPYNDCPSIVDITLNKVILLASKTEILSSLKQFKTNSTICLINEYSSEVLDSNFNTSGSGCNIRVVKSAGPNMPKQLAAKI